MTAPVLSSDATKQMREAFDKAFGGSVRDNCLALCDSHEAMRAHIEELERERHEARELSDERGMTLAGMSVFIPGSTGVELISGARKLSASVAALTAQLAAAREALEQIANHPTGWPPPEEENASMRGLALAALAAGKDAKPEATT